MEETQKWSTIKKNIVIHKFILKLVLFTQSLKDEIGSKVVCAVENTMRKIRLNGKSYRLF